MTTSITEIAQKVSFAVNQITGMSTHPHDIEDGGSVGGFDVSLDGELYAGGSFIVKDGYVRIVSMGTLDEIIGTVNSNTGEFISGLNSIEM